MFQNNGDPMFTMSMYGSSAELYKARAKYYQEKCEKLEEQLNALTPKEDMGNAIEEYFKSYNNLSEAGRARLDSLDKFYKDMGL